MATQTVVKVQGKAEAEDQIRQAHGRFASAIEAMFNGDLAPLGEVWSHGNDVSMFDPFGGRQLGWDQVRSLFEKCSKAIAGGRVVSKDLRVHVGSDIAYVTSYEAGEIRSADGRSTTFGMRACSIYRNENNEWKLIHHQVDESPSLRLALKNQPDAETEPDC
ncbi:MAG: nuclear transport factor 2 family protein [Phycisphaerae bacterium]|nr:nuclear transport factor 2 family protein [Phycisphaerae bacterium]